MQLYLPVIYSIDSKWFIDSLEAEIAEISESEAPEIVLGKDGAAGRHRYRMHEGRLYRRMEEWANNNGMRPIDIKQFRTADSVARAMELKPQKSHFARRNPFFDVADPVAFWGTHGHFELARTPLPREQLAATRMGRVTSDIAAHSILIGGSVYRETVGPILVRHHRSQDLDILDTHTRSYVGYLAFGIHDLETANEFCDRKGLQRIRLRGADELPKYDPAPRMLECLADMLRDHAFKYRINDMSRDYVERYMAVEKLMREGWRGTPANDGGPPIWPYQEYHDHNLIASELAGMMETVYSLYPLSYGSLKDAKAVAKFYIDSGRIPGHGPSAGPAPDDTGLADFTL